jgi:RNA polymerase sigma-70 factor (ECF subfamily)
MAPDRSIELILRQAAEGDEHAWRRIVETYTPRVFGLIRVQCGSEDLAEEITQSTFCTMAERIDRYAEQGRFESWLFRIAMNRLVESETLVGLAGGAEQAAGPAADEIEALRAAMARLSEADRQVVHLRHLAGLSFARIAEVLGEPLGTVLARQHRALKKLRDLLGGAADEP